MGGHGVRTGSAAVSALLMLLLLSPLAPARADPGAPQRVTVFSDPRLEESSGLVASRTMPGLLWTVADSGSAAEVYGVRAGRIVAVVRLAGVDNVDWEALAPGPGRTLWVADIGDNAERRSTVTLHRFAEPASTGTTSVRPGSATLRYPDGPHDAEALLVQPRTGRVLLVTKGLLAGAVYTADRVRWEAGAITRLRRVAAAPGLVSDGAWSPDGARLVLRTYRDALVGRRPGVTGIRVDLPAQEQGESVAWTLDGSALLIGSEGRDSVVWRVPVSAPAATAGTAPPGRRRAAPAVRTPAADATRGPVAATAAAGLLIAGVAGGALRRRRRRRRYEVDHDHRAVAP